MKNKAGDCTKCRSMLECLPGRNRPKTIDEKLYELQASKGKERIDILRSIINDKVFKPVEGLKNVYTAPSKTSKQDMANLLKGAGKAVESGNIVYILPNPKKGKSPDYIFIKKQIVKDYDLKAITGKNSAGNRLKESIGQTDRAILMLQVDYNPRSLTSEIKRHFKKNSEVLEVLIYKGNKQLSITRDMVYSKSLYKEIAKL